MDSGRTSGLLSSLWTALKWVIGLGPGKLVTWWDDLDFHVQYKDRLTGEVYRSYKLKCKIVRDDEEEAR